jgi:hypothetical protein
MKNQFSDFGNQMEKQRITSDIIKNSKSVVCECGGMLFREEVFFKILSPLLSPSGKEELVPMPVFVCTKCGKVPSFFDSQDVLPEEIKAKKIE